MSDVHAAIEKFGQTALKIKEQRDELLGACELLMGMIEDGTLVRDITKDASPDWGLKMMRFVQDLQKVQAAILRAKA